MFSIILATRGQHSFVSYHHLILLTVPYLRLYLWKQHQWHDIAQCDCIKMAFYHSCYIKPPNFITTNGNRVTARGIQRQSEKKKCRPLLARTVSHPSWGSVHTISLLVCQQHNSKYTRLRLTLSHDSSLEKGGIKRLLFIYIFIFKLYTLSS